MGVDMTFSLAGDHEAPAIEFWYWYFVALVNDNR
jgi:hypothetical protein